VIEGVAVFLDPVWVERCMALHAKREALVAEEAQLYADFVPPLDGVMSSGDRWIPLVLN